MPRSDLLSNLLGVDFSELQRTANLKQQVTNTMSSFIETLLLKVLHKDGYKYFPIEEPINFSTIVFRIFEQDNPYNFKVVLTNPTDVTNYLEVFYRNKLIGSVQANIDTKLGKVNFNKKINLKST